MIERLLEADRLLALGLTDPAERIYWQAVETDPRNAIAVVGLARVASERGDDRTALEFARKARAIDPENPAAFRLTARLEEIIATREGSAAATAAPNAMAVPAAATTEPVTAVPGAEATEAPAAGSAPAPAAGPASTAPTDVPRPAPARPGPRPMHKGRGGILGRLLGGR